jgi:hypothetical protein
MHALESCQLNVLVVELARIDAKLTEQKAQVVELQEIKEQGLSTPNRSSLESLTQGNLWINSVIQGIAVALKATAETERQRQEAHSRVLDRRAKVRGLEILIDQLKLQLTADAETQRAMMADEHALTEYTRN